MNLIGIAKPLIVELFSCAGGAGYGYKRAGWKVWGVDINPQPRYAGDRFFQDDALDFLANNWKRFDAIHASPPCQTHTPLAALHKNNTVYQAKHFDLIPQTRALLQATGKPWVMENVPGSTLKNYVTLCGTQFGLKVYRHRWFESNILLMVPPHRKHEPQPKAEYIEIVDYGELKRVKTTDCAGVMPNGFVSVCGNFGYLDYAGRAMGIDWMTQKELAQAIPPAYTEFLGKQLLRAIA